jgi:hypothetical protein
VYTLISHAGWYFVNMLTMGMNLPHESEKADQFVVSMGNKLNEPSFTTIYLLEKKGIRMKVFLTLLLW